MQNVKEEFEDTKGESESVYEEEQRTQWPKEKGQKDKQPSTNHTYKTEDKKNMNPTENRGLTQVQNKIYPFLAKGICIYVGHSFL
jgi:hypothetical protein